jgi:hypothetical protein
MLALMPKTPKNAGKTRRRDGATAIHRVCFSHELRARAGHQEGVLSLVAQTSERVNTAMKKLLGLGLLSVAALGWATAPASAWWPCFPMKGCCKSKCCSTICIRQYNAFTPVCTGSLCCDGCCPINFGAGGGCCPTNCCPTSSTCSAGGVYGDPYCMGQLPPAMPGMAAPVMAGAPNVQAPMPMSAAYGGQMGYNPYAAAYNPYAQFNPYAAAQFNPYAAAQVNPYAMGVQPAGYTAQTPYYWNAGGR